MRRSLFARTRIRHEMAFAAALVLIALLIAGISAHAPKPFVSSELAFTDASRGGLSIVPASCPSYEHTSGECSLPVSTNCTLTASSGAVPPGGAVTLSWSVTKPAITSLFTTTFSGNISPGVGSIQGWSGSVVVSPPVTTTYLLSGTMTTSIPWLGGTQTGSAQCQTTVTVSSAADGQQASCPAGEFAYNGTCVTSCPSGFFEFFGTCVGSCPIGYVQQGSACVFNACPTGYTLQGNACVSSCTPHYYCSGSDLLYQDAMCRSTISQSCTYGCANGACNLPAGPEVQLWQVRPLLVRPSDRVSVNWSVANVRSCTVSGSNGDSWAGTAGSQVSSPILSQTVYTLNCIALPGASPSTVTRSTVVNITPLFDER